MSKSFLNIFRKAESVTANGTTVANANIARSPCVLITGVSGSNILALASVTTVPDGFMQFICNNSGSPVGIHAQATQTINGYSSAVGITLADQKSCILVALTKNSGWFGGLSGNLL